MSYATANGIVLADCTLTIPELGPCLVDAMAPDGGPLPEAPGGVVVTVGTLAYRCTVVRQKIFGGDLRFRAVGGHAGWGRAVPAVGYSSPGSPLAYSALVADVARAVGETAVVTSTADGGAFWGRMTGPASQVFSLVGQPWFVDALGVTQVRARIPSATIAAFDLLEFDGELGRAVIRTDFPDTFLPGVSFVAPEIGTVAINSVAWRVSADTVTGELWIA